MTIGQSPRPDITDEIAPLLPQGARLVEAGALDGLTSDQVAALAPDDHDHTLVTLLRDGREVLVGHRHLLPRVQDRIAGLQDRADVILMLCTGTFPRFVSRRPVLYPEHLLFTVARAVAPDGCLGVLTPSARQVEEQERRWRAVGSKVIVRPYSPYHAGDDLDAACAAFRAEGTDLVILDCLGYTLALKGEVRRQVDRPTLLARSVLARVAAEIVR